MINIIVAYNDDLVHNGADIIEHVVNQFLFVKANEAFFHSHSAAFAAGKYKRCDMVLRLHFFLPEVLLKRSAIRRQEFFSAKYSQIFYSRNKNLQVRLLLQWPPKGKWK